MLCAIPYLKHSDKYRVSDLKKRINNNYVFNNEEYLRTITKVQSLILN